MRQTRAVLVGALVASLFIPSFAFGEENEKKTKKELQEEAKKAAEERTKQMDQLKKTQQLSEQILKQQQIIIQQQQNLESMLERTRVQAKAVLPKEVFTVSESFPFDFVLTNASQKTFVVDGRKGSPGYEIRDEKGNIVSTSKGRVEKSDLKKEGMINFNPKENLTYSTKEAVAPSKPGLYSFRAFHALATPDGKDLPPNVWFASIHTAPVRMRVVEKKEEKKSAQP